MDIIVHQQDTGKITFSASNPQTALFYDERVSNPSKNKVQVFPEIEGCQISDVGLLSPCDRWIRLSFSDSPYHLLIKMFSGSPNAWLIKGDEIVNAFKKPSNWSDKPVELLNLPKAEGKEQDPDMAVLSQKKSIKEKILYIDRRFPRGLINDLNESRKLEQMEEQPLVSEVEHLTATMRKAASALITKKGTMCLLPETYLPEPPEKTFSSVNDAVRSLFLSKNRTNRLEPQKKDLLARVERKVTNLKKQEEELSKAPQRLKKSEQLEMYGHYLMSQPDPEDVFQDDFHTIEGWDDELTGSKISVTPGMSKIRQAEVFYDKAAKIKKDVSLSDDNRKRIEEQQNRLSSLHRDLEKINHPSELDKWLKHYAGMLQQMGISGSTKRQEARPFKERQLDGYDIWIGKSAKSNDEVLARSHKEDIWLHVRDQSGSHVIIRQAGHTDWPPKETLLKAAALAAAHSKQSGAALVPVQMAKRKHIRKPKGGAPGLVLVTNERVEMVKPEKP